MSWGIIEVKVKGGLIAKMKFLWLFAAVAALYGAIAASFFEGSPLTAIAFALLAIVFCLAAYRDMSTRA